MRAGTVGGQTLVIQSCQVGVVQPLAGETAGRQLLGKCLCAQRQFLPRLFLGLGDALRSTRSKEARLAAPSPGAGGSLRGRDDEIDVPFNERALGGDLLQEFGLAVRERIPGRRVLPIPFRVCEQALDVGRQVLSPVAHQDLQGKGQGFDERGEALDDGFLLVLRFKRQVDGRDLQHSAIAASGGRTWGVEAEHLSPCFAQAQHVALDAGLLAYVLLHRASSRTSVWRVCWLARSSSLSGVTSPGTSGYRWCS